MSDWRVVKGAREAMFSGAESGGTWLLRTDWTKDEGRDERVDEVFIEEERESSWWPWHQWSWEELGKNSYDDPDLGMYGCSGSKRVLKQIICNIELLLTSITYTNGSKLAINFSSLIYSVRHMRISDPKGPDFCFLPRKSECRVNWYSIKWCKCKIIRYFLTTNPGPSSRI